MKHARIQTPDAAAHAPEKSSFSAYRGDSAADADRIVFGQFDEATRFGDQPEPNIEIIVSTLSRLAAIPAVALSLAVVLGLFAWVL